MKCISILGCRGIPARHGGFETFAEYFSRYLVDKGWKVRVYCQEEGSGSRYEDSWEGVKLVHIPVPFSGPFGTIIFDWLSTWHAAAQGDPVLTLGYNTALFNLLYRLRRVPNIINMDGIEWRRGKWGPIAKIWFYMNEKVGAWLGNYLIADHPEIKKHLSRYVSPDKIAVIPYNAKIITEADETLLAKFKISPFQYNLLVARPEPENSILEVVRAYSRKDRALPLVVLGDYNPRSNGYHEAVMKAAKGNVKFVGAIYEENAVQALRWFARFYIHGHTVGGTNPSLVEALGAGNAVLAHDNKFNRWVAGEHAAFFKDEQDCARQLDHLLVSDEAVAQMREHSRRHMRARFTPDKVYRVYEELFLKYQKS